MSSRISTSQIFDASQTHISNAREKEIENADKASSMKKIVRPSQDPAGWVTATNIKDNLSARDAIAKNAELANHVLTATENIFSQVQDYIQRAHELAVGTSSSGTTDEKAREFALYEVRGLFENSIRALNTSYGGRTLLGGFQTRQAAYGADGKYLGDDGKIQIEIGQGLLVPINVSATQIIQGRGLKDGVDVMETFKRLMSGLQLNDVDVVRSTLEDLLRSVDQLSIGRTQIGARQSEIQRAVAAHDMDRIERLDTISLIEEADPAKVFSDLARDQTVLKAAISTSQKILLDDPLNYFFKN